MDDLLTIRQVAILLKVHQLSVRRYISSGKLNAVKAGGNVRVTQKDLQSFVENYTPNKLDKTQSINKNTSSPFAPNDSLFRIKGRGLSLDNFEEDKR